MNLEDSIVDRCLGEEVACRKKKKKGKEKRKIKS